MKIFLINLVLFVLILPVFADGIHPAGEGTENSPYLINSLDNLLWLSTNSSVWPEGNYYLQTSNINAQETAGWNNGEGFNTIGDMESDFIGHYNGDYYSIDGIHILQQSGIDYVGFFGRAENSILENMDLKNFYVTGGSWVGCLAGSLDNSVVRNCRVQGYVEGFNQVGGLAGSVSQWQSNEEIAIKHCFSDVTVNGSDGVGNFLGHAFSAKITECYAIGYTHGYASGWGDIGGFIGSCYQSQITDCYASGEVSGEFIVGGFAGRSSRGSISRCYCKGYIDYLDPEYTGGFVGFNYINSEITDCVWDIETTGQIEGIGKNEGGNSSNLLGKTTAEMKMMNTYTDLGWDFMDESINGEEDYWDLDESLNAGYPYLCKIIFEPHPNEINKILTDSWVSPHPFRSSLRVYFELSEGSQVCIDVYNLKGQKVDRISNDYYIAGTHARSWQAEDHCSGMYLILIKTDKETAGHKALLIK